MARTRKSDMDRIASLEDVDTGNFTKAAADLLYLPIASPPAAAAFTGATALAGASTASGDLFLVDDVSAAATKKITRDELAIALGVPLSAKTVSGQTTLTSAATTVVTGLSAVTLVVASLESDPVLTCAYVSATIGDQVAAPVAGSVILNAWMPTAVDDATPIAATGFATKTVNWIAVGTP